MKPTISSEDASNAVHKTAKTAEDATRVGGVAGGAALGGLGGSALGPIGIGIGAVIGGIIGGIVGGAVGSWVNGAVDTVGGAIVNALGFDYITHGKTPSGGEWTNVKHPDGTYRREENAGGFTVVDSTTSDGSYHQSVDGNGYHSDFTQGRGGSSTFNASDREGGYHSIDHDSSGNYVTGDSDGKGNSTVHSSDGNGNSTTFSTRTDENGNVTTTETSTTTDSNSGDRTTTTTTTKPDGTTSTTTETTDKDGNPKDDQPDDEDHPDHGGNGGGMDNPEGGNDEGPRVKPGDMGRPRPGHPNDLVVVPTHSGGGDDYNEGNDKFYVRLGNALSAMALVMGTGAGGGNDSGWGDANGGETLPDLRNKLKGAHFYGPVPGSGEDFIHPQARGSLLSRIGMAITNGRF